VYVFAYLQFIFPVLLQGNVPILVDVIRDLPERNLAVSVVQDGGRGGVATHKADAAAAEAAKETATTPGLQVVEVGQVERAGRLGPAMATSSNQTSLATV
jgi:hypothetical protein